MPPKVSIVILNWNGRHYLEKFLPSVLASTYSNFEVIVADNGSSDDSVSFLINNFPTVRLILFKANHGFATGYNLALKQVHSPYYVLLNSDVEVDKNWLQPMVELLENSDTIAACQPKLLAYNNPEMFEYAGAAGGWIDKFAYPFARGRIFDVCERDEGQYESIDPIFWASGAAMFVRSKVFHDMHGFDDYFFAHQEEIDLCWRMQLAGYHIYSCPSAVVYHVGGGTLPKGNSKKTYLNFRNNMIMMYKNMPWREKWWRIPYRQFLNGVSAWKGLLSGDGGYFVAIVRSHAAFVRWWIFRKRQSKFPIKKNGRLHGVFQGNVVWEHFWRKKTTFRDIVR